MSCKHHKCSPMNHYSTSDKDKKYSISEEIKPDTKAVTISLDIWTYEMLKRLDSSKHIEDIIVEVLKEVDY